MKKQALSALVLGSTLVAAPSFAHEAGDLIVRVGAVHVEPDSSVNGTSVPGLDVDDDTSIGTTATYMLTDHIGVELLAATFKHDITLNGNKVADTRHLPPTLSLQYYPMESGSKWQPFVGLGVNYTTFFSESDLGGQNLKLDDSFGLAAQIGLDYQINEKWLVNATVWKMDLDSDVELNGTNIGEVNIDPTVVLLSVGYKF